MKKNMYLIILFKFWRFVAITVGHNTSITKKSVVYGDKEKEKEEEICKKSLSLVPWSFCG